MIFSPTETIGKHARWRARECSRSQIIDCRCTILRTFANYTGEDHAGDPWVPHSPAALRQHELVDLSRAARGRRPAGDTENLQPGIPLARADRLVQARIRGHSQLAAFGRRGSLRSPAGSAALDDVARGFRR